MVNGYIISSTVFAIAFILLGSLVLSRSPKSTLHRLFLTFSVLMAFWLITNYAAGTSTTPYNLALLANRSVFFFAGASLYVLLAFVKEVSRRSYQNYEKILFLFTPLLLVAGLTPLVVSDVSAQGTTYTIEFGILAAPYFVAILALAVLSISNLLRARKKAKLAIRSQIDTILVSFGIALVGVVVTNAVLPFVFSFYAFTNAGSFFTAFFVIGTAYSIVRHGLFDIRLIVARSLAYTGVIAMLAMVYGAATYGVSVFILRGQSNQLILGIVNVALIVLASVTFTPLKKAFDRFTNSIFYRDAYDSQVLLDEFNKVLVSTIELDVLLARASAKIQEHIKSDYCVITVQKTEDASRHIEGTENRRFAEDDLQFLDKVTPEVAGVVIAVDLLGDEHQQLKQSLNKSNVSVISRLVNHAAEGDSDIGYIIFGSKKSGNLYSQQDLTLIEILSNELVIAVQNALRFEEIEKFNITLQEKIETATRRLQRNNEKLKAMDETKDEFISMASHQLRTPLTSVKGYLSMVLEGDAGELNAMQRKLLDQAFISSQRMVYLIADLLNVSRLHTGKFIIDAAPTSLADVIEGEAQQLEKTATGRGLVLSYKKPQNFPLLMLDETKIRQVVMNFLDNAIYYSKPGGHIEILLTHTDDSVEFKVVDDGIGVPKHEQPQLFNKFYRAGNAKKARPDGTGLGLFMAKKVVVAQGGSIVFKSEEGKGSTFGFVFGKQKLALPKVSQPKSAATSK